MLIQQSERPHRSRKKAFTAFNKWMAVLGRNTFECNQVRKIRALLKKRRPQIRRVRTLHNCGVLQ
jgi:16S rRNA C967 or C1407 C5-methylase (RsmB/RsmF family)